MILALTIDEGLLLQDILQMVRTHCEGKLEAELLLDSYAYRRLNSDIDPIISQIEEELEYLGAN